VKEFGSFLRTPLPKESNFSSFLTFPINESKVIMFDIALSCNKNWKDKKMWKVLFSM
jgi:hypothetical protein